MFLLWPKRLKNMLKFLTSVGNTGQKEIGGNVYAEI